MIPGLTGLTLGDFWSWAYSDVVSNANRSVFAEFIVGSALGLTGKPRVEWDCVDFRFQGRPIEVKASAYINWIEDRPSRIVFDIGPKIPWDAERNLYGQERVRSAACYVFCFYPETDRSKCNVLDVNRWRFYVFSTSEIEARFRKQKSVSLRRIEAACQPVVFSDLRRKVEDVLGLVQESAAI